MAKVIMKGNEAIAKAAIVGGCRYFMGYPITPQNEIPEYLSRELPKVGGTFIQAESEVAAINMVYGAGAAGARVMTSSSSPGIALKQEGIGYLIHGEIPAVIVSMMRGGPALGTIQPGQSDYFQSKYGGANGDKHLPVLLPGNIQEAVDDVKYAFEMADHYRHPVIVCCDGLIGQMMEPVDFDHPVEIKSKEDLADWALGHSRPGERNFIYGISDDAADCERRNIKWWEGKYAEMEATEARYEEWMMDDAEYAFVGYGTTARILKTAAVELRKEGIKIGLIRPKTAWPFPVAPFENKNIKKFIVGEMNMGQMVEDVKASVDDKHKVEFHGRCGGIIPTPEEYVEFAKKVIGGAE